MHRNFTNDEIISKLLNNPLFKNAEKYKLLLQYLYECYESDKIPTEFDIAADVFYKDKEFNPAEDTTVRVYIYRLRKKLDEYYENSGKHDPVIVQIQKGTYHIEFLKHSELNKRKVLKFKQYLYPVILFILLILITFLCIEYISIRNQLYINDDIRSNKLVWSEFTSNGLPTIYAVGCLYSYYYYLEQFDRSWLIRDDAINNERELNEFEENYHLDENNISLPDWKIIPKSAALHYGKLLPIFHLKTSRLELKPTDELKWSDIENNNIIYIGHFHNLSILNSIFPRNRLISQVKSSDHGIKKYFIKVKTSEIDTLYPIILSENKSQHLETDYVVVSKIPGPKNNVILFICSFSSMGRLKLIDTFTSAKMLSALEQNILKSNTDTPKYFEMLVKVSGFLDRGLETKIMHLFELPSNFVLMKEQPRI